MIKDRILSVLNREQTQCLSKHGLDLLTLGIEPHARGQPNEPIALNQPIERSRVLAHPLDDQMSYTMSSRMSY